MSESPGDSSEGEQCSGPNVNSSRSESDAGERIVLGVFGSVNEKYPERSEGVSAGIWGAGERGGSGVHPKTETGN